MSPADWVVIAIATLGFVAFVCAAAVVSNYLSWRNTDAARRLRQLGERVDGSGDL